MPQTKPIVSIENVVVSATVEQALDLDNINKKFPEVEYNPKEFPGAIFKLKSPKTAILLFRTGNMVCTGAKSEDMAKKAVSNVVEKLRAKNVKIKNDPKVSVENIVSAVNLGGRIHLEQAARVLPKSMYEPEQFPGLVHRMIDPKTVILLFASGKLVCTGGKSSQEVFRAIHNIHTTLEEKDLMYYDQFQAFLDAECTFADEQWVFSLADLVVYGLEYENKGSKLVQIRFYPVDTTEFIPST